MPELLTVHGRHGICIDGAGFTLDGSKGRGCSVVSHAHSDHVASHALTVASRPTAALLRERYGRKREIVELDWGEPWERDGFRTVLTPAGHVLGSAMVHVTRISDGASLLYTGDYKLRGGLSCEPAVPLGADLLIMECTFGMPRYVFPDTDTLRGRMHEWCRSALERGEVPVLLGYSLGKAQEIQMLLGDAFRISVHPAVAAMNLVYAGCGIQLPHWEPASESLEGCVLVMPPAAGKDSLLSRLPKKAVAMVSGWGLDSSAKYRYRVDEVFPLSDHADYPDLLRLVEQVNPRRVLTTHGYCTEFAATLRARGVDAWSLHGGDQLELFQDSAFDEA